MKLETAAERKTPVIAEIFNGAGTLDIGVEIVINRVEVGLICYKAHDRCRMVLIYNIAQG